MATVAGSASPSSVPADYLPGGRKRWLAGVEALTTGASLTYVYRAAGGTIATATSLPLPAGGVLLRTVSS